MWGKSEDLAGSLIITKKKQVTTGHGVDTHKAKTTTKKTDKIKEKTHNRTAVQKPNRKNTDKQQKKIKYMCEKRRD